MTKQDRQKEGLETTNFLTNMNRAIDYIEEHLPENVDYSKLAELAQCSSYHFQRFFTYICGISLTEYIRRRRLSKAAFEIQQCDTKIIDIALKYGYESPTSFTRAFQALHGVTPTEARKGRALKAYPKITFHFSIKGNEALTYKIIEKPPFRMIAMKEHVSKWNDENLNRMPKLWKDRHQERKIFASLSKETQQSVYGLTMNYSEQGFDYCLGAVSDQPIPQGFIEIKLPAAQWAIFQCTGPLPTAQYEMWRRIFREWIPFSGYELAELCEVEWYAGGNINAADYESEIWLPLQKNTR